MTVETTRASDLADEPPPDGSLGPQVGERAPEFFLGSLWGTVKASELARRVGKLILVSQDSHRFHGR